MARFPCLPLWTDAWLADTAHLSRQERGTYLDLLILMWRTPGCRVPNDNAWLATHLRLSLAEVETSLREVIAEFCQTDGNYISQKRLRREFTKQFEFGKVQSARSARRWHAADPAASNRSASLTPATDPDKSLKNQGPDISPRGESHLPYLKERKIPSSFLPSFALPREENRSKKPARLLATALPAGALAREPFTDPDQQEAADKRPEDLTLAEINRKWRQA